MSDDEPRPSPGAVLAEAGFEFAFLGTKLIRIQSVVTGEVSASFQVKDTTSQATLRLIVKAFLAGRKSAIGEIPKERGR